MQPVNTEEIKPPVTSSWRDRVDEGQSFQQPSQLSSYAPCFVFASTRLFRPSSSGPSSTACGIRHGQQCKAVDGACWSVVTKNLRFILFGFYPWDEQWRPRSQHRHTFRPAFITAATGATGTRRLGYVWLVGVVVMGVLMHGGIFGLPEVETSQWSGICSDPAPVPFWPHRRLSSGSGPGPWPPFQDAGHQELCAWSTSN